MNLYYDYKIEACLQEWEDKFNDYQGVPQVGFYGHDSSYDTTDDYALRKEINVGNKPDKEDAISSTNVYWTVFGNLAKSLDEEEIL